MQDYIDRVTVFPEEVDHLFSQELWDSFVELALRFGTRLFGIEIAEKYDTESTPHYHFCRVMRGFDSTFTKVSQCDAEHAIWYDAKEKKTGKIFVGKVIARVFSDASLTRNKCLVSGLAGRYDAAIDKYYGEEWDTEYLDHTRKLGPIIPIGTPQQFILLQSPHSGSITAADWAA